MDPNEILKSPDFINANDETKRAIFDKHIASSPDYTNANSDTQLAIQQRFGVTPVVSDQEIANQHAKSSSWGLSPGVATLGLLAGFAAPKTIQQGIDLLTPKDLRGGFTPPPPAAAPTATAPSVSSPEYFTEHGAGVGAVKNAEHNLEQILKNRASEASLHTPGFSSPGNSLLLIPNEANIPTRTGGLPNVEAPSAPPVAKPISEYAREKFRSPEIDAPKRFGSAFGTASALGLGADAYEQAKRGNLLGAATSGAGSAGALASLHSNPKIAGAGKLGLAAALANKAYQAFGDKNKKAAGGVIQGYNKGKIVEDVVDLAKKFKYDPAAVTHAYPKTIPPVLAIDPKKGNEFLQKQLSSEAKAVQNARKYAQAEIDKGAYTPFFDITKRFHVDPANYPLPVRTIDVTLPKKAETIATHTAKANDPAAIGRLNAAYDAAKGHPGAHDFYAMGQLEDAFIKELGPEAGRAAFKSRFADPLAATTGGADPNSNLMTAAYSNYVRQLGQDLPAHTYELPYPVGGRYVSGNIEQARKYHDLGSLDPVSNPKRYNFSSNFQGHLDRPTVDEQMMNLFDPKGKKAPDWYGINEETINKLAQERGVSPVNFQEVAWAGGKGYEGKPMMQEINEMIHRTSRITGQSPDEVLKGFIHGNRPMYGIGAGGLGALNAMEDQGE